MWDESIVNYKIAKYRLNDFVLTKVDFILTKVEYYFLILFFHNFFLSGKSL